MCCYYVKAKIISYINTLKKDSHETNTFFGIIMYRQKLWSYIFDYITIEVKMSLYVLISYCD